MRNARNSLGAFPCSRALLDARHFAAANEAELGALVDHTAIAGGELARFAAVDDDLGNSKLAFERLAARFEIDRACKASHLFRQLSGCRHGGNQGVQALGLRRFRGNFLGGFRFFRKLLDDFAFDENRDDLIGQFGFGDGRFTIRFSSEGDGTGFFCTGKTCNKRNCARREG